MLIWGIAGAKNEASTIGRCAPKAAVLERTRTFPVRSRAWTPGLAPRALDLLDDEPRMIKEALAGRGQRDTTAIARQEVYTKLLLHSTNAGDAVEACNDSGGCTGHLAADDAAACPQILMK